MPSPRHVSSGRLCLVLGAALLAGCSDRSAPRIPPLEERLTYAFSQLSILTQKHPPVEGWNLAFAAMDEIDGGKPFDQVARQRSEDPESAPMGGFVGFYKPQGQDPLAGALQVLPPGLTGGPLQTERALLVIRRHTYAEAKELEARYLIPMYGFLVRYGEGAGAQYAERSEAEKVAQEAWEKVRSKEMTIAQAAEKYASGGSDRPDAFARYARPVGAMKAVHDALQKVAPGELAPVVPVGEGALGVFVRARHLRCFARHILIGHAQSAMREMGATRTREEAKAIAEKVLAEAEPDGANWVDLVKRYSDEPGSALQLGTMGCIGNGDLLPDLEQALLDTQPGRVASRYVETQVGFHVIWRMD